MGLANQPRQNCRYLSAASMSLGLLMSTGSPQSQFNEIPTSPYKKRKERGWQVAMTLLLGSSSALSTRGGKAHLAACCATCCCKSARLGHGPERGRSSLAVLTCPFLSSLPVRGGLSCLPLEIRLKSCHFDKSSFNYPNLHSPILWPPEALIFSVQ